MFKGAQGHGLPMIRTKTAIIVGAGAGIEIEMPGQRDLLTRIAQGFDFQRLGTELQTDEMRDFDALFRSMKGQEDDLREAALRIRSGSRLSSSIHALLQQHGEDRHVVAAGKLAIAYFTLRAEDHAPMAAEPRDPGDLPLRGNENWLFQLASMVVDGVPRARAETCFDHLHIVNFNTDRSIEHYMPWALHLGFGMNVTEAQDLCAQKLRVVHPYGRAGRLPWQQGGDAQADWGEIETKALPKVAEAIRTASQFKEDRSARASLSGGIANARRLVFLGFDFNPLDTALLFDDRLGHAPDTLVGLAEDDQRRTDTIRRVLKGSAGIGSESLVALNCGQNWQMLRDHAALLES